MLYDARVTAMKVKKRPRCGQSSLALVVFLITINIINLIILTRCTTSHERAAVSTKTEKETVNNDNPFVDYHGDRDKALQEKHDGAWIPKILHITWKNTMIPGGTAAWVKKWTVTNPDYAVWFWSDDDSKDFIKKYYSDFLDTFTKYPTGIFRADAIRYIVLYHYGGIYADLDVEPIKSLNPIRHKYACVVAREPAEHAELAWNLPEDKHLACNAFMACRPHHPFMRLIIDMLELNGAKESNPVIATGPMMLTRTLKIYNNVNKLISSNKSADDVFLAPSDYFIPRVDQIVIDRLLPHCGDPSIHKKKKKFCEKFNRGDYRNGPSPDSYTDHHWWHSWFVEGKKVKARNIAQVIPYVSLASSKFLRDSDESL